MSRAVFPACLGRKAEDKRSALTGYGLEANLPARLLDNLLADGEAQASALACQRFCVVCAIELTEDVRLRLERDADAAIGHFTHQVAVVALQTDAYTASRRRVFDRVADQVHP